jgi:hypothetical protein
VQLLCPFDLRQIPKLASFGFFAESGGAYVPPGFVNAGDNVSRPPKHFGVSVFYLWARLIDCFPRLLTAPSCLLLRPERTADSAATVPFLRGQFATELAFWRVNP